MTLPTRAQLDRLCGPDNWRVIGVSALVYDRHHAYLEIGGPRHWRTEADAVVALLGCIGGHLEPGEHLLDCLAREAREEIGIALRVIDAPATHLVFRDRLLPETDHAGDAPRPWLCTVGPNRLPDATGDAKYLVIVTYLAEALAKPSLRDLFGLIAVPRDALHQALPSEPTPWRTYCRTAGATLSLSAPLPPSAHLLPALTARSIRLLLDAGHPPLNSLIDSVPR
jgi:8-oxo-dGTP pyrophosphatase MutT (NUDIX family)